MTDLTANLRGCTDGVSVPVQEVTSTEEVHAWLGTVNERSTAWFADGDHVGCDRRCGPHRIVLAKGATVSIGDSSNSSGALPLLRTLNRY